MQGTSSPGKLGSIACYRHRLAPNSISLLIRDIRADLNLNVMKNN